MAVPFLLAIGGVFEYIYGLFLQGLTFDASGHKGLVVIDIFLARQLLKKKFPRQKNTF